MTRPVSQPLSALFLLVWPESLELKGIFPDLQPWIGTGSVPALQKNGLEWGEAQDGSERP